jgi:hypothetical protein
MTPVGLTATGGALAITGYGISRALKGRSFDLKKGSELERELSDIELTSETDQLVLDDAKLSGSIDTGKIDVSPGGADPIDLEKGSLVQSNGAVISDGFSVSEELAQAESSLRIEGDGAPTDTPVDGEISVKATELDDQVKMNIGLNLENGEFSASSNAEIDSSIRDDKTQAPGPKIEHELSDIELTSETDKLAIDNSELSGTIDTGKIDVSQGKVDTLELEKGTLVQPDPSKLDTLDGPSMSEESVHTESTLRIEGDGTQTDIPLDGEISIKATENEGQVKMNVGLDLENDEFSVSSKKKVDSSGQDEKTNKRDN